MKITKLTIPELMFVVGTRVALGAGVALLAANRLSKRQRRVAGRALVAAGAITTIPAALAVFRRH